MTCLSENTFQQLLDGALPEARLADTERHLDTCRSCRELFSALARALSTSANARPAEDECVLSEADAPAPSAMAPGTRVGRFIVRGPLGAGGMGVVHAAEDPVLGRKVALKLIHAAHREGPASEEWRVRLLREARAIARLSHPNVITVHDIGLHGDQLFVAMELVEGDTLRSWLAASPRSWREVIAVFVAAGRGLLAAHQAGLVHRDFKPDNVLLGIDGQVRVTDFGLAYSLTGAARDDHSDTEPGSSEDAFAALGSGLHAHEGRLTRSGTLIGTPGYIAPEVLRGGPADFASDQFSFCVALHQALSRADGVPGWLHQTVERGLRRRPEDRYPSMERLLAALNRESTRRRSMHLGLAMVAMVALAVGVGLVVAREPEQEICTGAREQVSAVWNPEMSAQLQSGFAATARPHARWSADRVAERLDAYTGQWASRHRATCLATARKEQSYVVLDRRLLCLARRLDQVGALLDLLVRQTDGTLVDRAIDLVGDLEPLSTCSDPAMLLS
ncbi:MAG: protein kinase domain-containing protein, partial [bacterium]